METNNEKLIRIAQDALDTEVTPKDETPDYVACAEVVSTLIKKVFPDFPVISSTAELFQKLKADKRFKATLTPIMGCIVVSPRTASTYGHTGIFITNERIASNESKTGIFRGNYSWSSWIAEFVHKRNLHTYLFEIIS